MSKRTPAGSPKVAIGYLRVSTDEQRLGPEAQRAAVEAWAVREGIQVAAWHVDQGVSGAKAVEERPGLLAALEALREHGAGVLAVAKRDRIARDVVIAATVERAAAKAGARVVSADGTANGDTAADGFMRVVIDGAAAYERALIRKRTKEALAAKAARGECVGQVPYGFRREGKRLVAVEGQQATIARARELASGRTLRAIAAQLAAEGHVSATGRTFAPVQVARMLAGSDRAAA
jgi:DNA invertase Pin-like site-specific DNA recombinase